MVKKCWLCWLCWLCLTTTRNLPPCLSSQTFATNLLLVIKKNVDKTLQEFHIYIIKLYIQCKTLKSELNTHRNNSCTGIAAEAFNDTHIKRIRHNNKSYLNTLSCCHFPDNDIVTLWRDNNELVRLCHQLIITWSRGLLYFLGTQHFVAFLSVMRSHRVTIAGN